MQKVKKIKVLITSTSFQDTPGDHHEYLKSLNWKIDFLRGPLTAKKLISCIGNYNGVICGDDEINKEVIDVAKNGITQGISKYGVGVDKIDIDYAIERKMKVKNCPGINTASVSEHVFGLLLAFKKNIHKEYNETKNGKWPRILGGEINGSNFGVLGLGNIGKKVAILARSFGCNVYFFDKSENKKFAKKNNLLQCDSIEELFESIDIASIHINLNNENKGIISQNLIEKNTRPGIIIINTSRGKLVDESAIISGLRSKIISGYLADVLSEEPPNKNNQLLKCNNVIITSHIASKTIENVCNQGIMAINNLKEII